VKLGAPIDLTPEELAQVSAPAPAPAAQLGQPIDALEDFEVYNAVEDEKERRGYDPDDPGVGGNMWSMVKDMASSLWSATKETAKISTLPLPLASVKATALASQTAGKVLAGLNAIDQGRSMLQEIGSAKLAAIVAPEHEAEMKKISRRAAYDFQRNVRDAELATDNFNQHLEERFPTALRGLGSVPVDNEAATGLSIIADPTSFVPFGAGARWTTQVPLRGAVRAASAAMKEAARDVAVASAKRESAMMLLKPGIDNAQWSSVRTTISKATEDLQLAKLRQEQATSAFLNTTAEQRAVVDQLATEASQQPLVQRAAAAGASGIGAAAQGVGGLVQKIAQAPEWIANRVAGSSDDAARSSIAEGVRNVASGFGVVPAVAGVAGAAVSRAGRNLSTFGRLLAEAESQLPFFKRLARESEGVPKFAASLIDQSGLGQLVTPVARAAADATRGLPFAAATGYVASGGEADGAAGAVGGGFVFGLAGGGYGQWQRYSSGGVFRQRQLADVARYKQTIATGEAKNYYANMPAADQAAIATMQLAHPDLRIQYARRGAGRASFYYVAEDGPVAVINLDSRNAVPGLVAHEIGHHLERHELGSAVERVLLGDPLIAKPGLFSALDAEGRPTVGPDGRYVTNAEWGALRQTYEARLVGEADAIGQAMKPRTDGQMAREVFAEHAADYLLGRDGNLTRDLRANVWSRAIAGIAGSEFTANAPLMRSILGKLGVPLSGRDRRVHGTGLFPNGLQVSPDLARLISRYHRNSARGIVPQIGDDPGNTRFTPDEIRKNPQILDKLFDGTDDLKRDAQGRVVRAENGEPVYTTPKERKAQRAELAAGVAAELEALQSPGAATSEAPQIKREVLQRGNSVEEGWATPGVPDAVIDRLKESGRFNPVQLEHLRRISQNVRAGEGQSVMMFYQPAALDGKRYQGLAGDTRTETPYGIFVSNAGNIVVRFASKEKLMANVQRFVEQKRAGLWNNSTRDLVADIDTYLANHAAGRPGSDTIGVQKRDAINYLFGINTEKNKSANPWHEASPKVSTILRSRRLDRMNNLAVVEERFPTRYDMLNANLLPEGEVGGSAANQVGRDQHIRALDSLGQKDRLQTKASVQLTPYAINPIPESVTLPPRWGLVNRNIVGMPRNHADVTAVVDRVEARLRDVMKDHPEFAKESARFYRDMADSAESMVDVVYPDVKGDDVYNHADLMLRFLALGSPRSAVITNSTKSAGSAAAGGGGFTPGYKLGFTGQQRGGADTFTAWRKGGHFDLEKTSGVDDKVRSFYLNGLSELIERGTERGHTSAVNSLLLRAAKSMNVVPDSTPTLTPALATETMRLLDGKATVDMWDMAGKGFARAGYILRRSARNKASQPFQWSQDAFAKQVSLADNAWQTVQKELAISSPADLRYQQARALEIDGNPNWTAKTWAARQAQPFPPSTTFTYFTRGTEAGLTPGGGGPMYDAQQAIDGLVADRLNADGFAGAFGKTKLKARNAQEILWALEKMDNPIEANNDLSLFGNSFSPLLEHVRNLRLGKDAPTNRRAAAILGAMDRAYNQMALQEMPFEVVTKGTSPAAALVQNRISSLYAGGDTNAVATMTDAVADGLGAAVNDIATRNGIDVTVSEIRRGQGGYTEGGAMNISPNILMLLRGAPAETRKVLDVISRALDQDGGNILRKPTIREMADVRVKKNTAVTFDTRGLNETQRDAFVVALSELRDRDNKPFLTGFTETSDGIAIGDQFYDGDMTAALVRNRDKLGQLVETYGVASYRRDSVIIETFSRGTPESKLAQTPFAKELTEYLQDRVRNAEPTPRTFPQIDDSAQTLRARIAVQLEASSGFAKTKRKAALDTLKSTVDAAWLRDEIDPSTHEALKDLIPKDREE